MNMTLAFLRLLEEYMGASYERKMELEKQYGKNLLQRGQQEMETNTWMLSNAQKCPNCSTFFLLSHMKSRGLIMLSFIFYFIFLDSSVQKLSGCNKMTCTVCNGVLMTLFLFFNDGY